MSMGSSGTSKEHDETIKLIGIGFIAVVIMICLLVNWLNPSAKPPKPVYPICDYCRVGQKDAKPFPCRQCGKTHLSCGRESGLRAFDARKDKEGIAVGRSIKTCPEGSTP